MQQWDLVHILVGLSSQYMNWSMENSVFVSTRILIHNQVKISVDE